MHSVCMYIVYYDDIEFKDLEPKASTELFACFVSCNAYCSTLDVSVRLFNT